MEYHGNLRVENFGELENLLEYSIPNIVLRGRIHRIRPQAKIIFIVLRSNGETVQCIYVKKAKIGDPIAESMQGLARESIVDIYGIIKVANPLVKSCTIQKIEIEIENITLVSSSKAQLPIQIEEHIYLPHKSNSEREIESKMSTRFDNRVVDLRRADNQFIFKMQSLICRLIRRFFEHNQFMEIHTPKLIATASEGGSNVFEVDYFNKKAYLAQSPQLYKQMAICADFSRVYEIGPVFRAEKSYTHRHLTEFTGIDMEMTITNHYHEILDMFDLLFTNLFTNLEKEHGSEINSFWTEFGIEKFEYQNPSLRITFKQAVQFLREAGVQTGDFEDLNTEKEKMLGKIIKEKYHTDFFMVDQFPTEIRPFYTMVNCVDPLYSNSYDFFIRGEEILSGAQRINNYEDLLQSALDHSIDTDKIQGYLDSFKYGVPPHGGGGIGLERVVMLYLGINNIRNVSMFPRDPVRITP